MTYILILYLNNTTIQLGQTFKTETECRYEGAKIEAQTRTVSNFKDLKWNCIKKD